MVQEEKYFILSNLACNEENNNKTNLTFIQSGPMTAVSAASVSRFLYSLFSSIYHQKRPRCLFWDKKKPMFHFCKLWPQGTDESYWKKPTFIFWSIKGIFHVQYILSSIASILWQKTIPQKCIYSNNLLKIIWIALRKKNAILMSLMLNHLNQTIPNFIKKWN